MRALRRYYRAFMPSTFSPIRTGTYHRTHAGSRCIEAPPGLGDVPREAPGAFPGPAPGCTLGSNLGSQ